MMACGAIKLLEKDGDAFVSANEVPTRACDVYPTPGPGPGEP